MGTHRATKNRMLRKRRRERNELGRQKAAAARQATTKPKRTKKAAKPKRTTRSGDAKS